MEGQGKAPQLGVLLFEHCTSLRTATLPASITEIPRNCFYNDPIESFYIGANNTGKVENVKIFGEGCFFGNQFTTLDLSRYTCLRKIEGIAFAFVDSLEKTGKEGESANVSRATHGGNPTFTSIILPNQLAAGAGDSSKPSLFMNTGVFYGQVKFDTMQTPAKQLADTVYIPNYLEARNSQALFGMTGVSFAKWQVDIDSSAEHICGRIFRH